MSERLRKFTKAVYGFDAVVQRVPEDAWDRPSPCEGWSARDVVYHQISVLAEVAEQARGGDVALPQMAEDRRDPVGAWNETRDDMLEALDGEGALARTGPYWFGEMSMEQLIGVVQWDPLIHAWDLSVAVGLDPLIDQDLYADSLTTIEPMANTLRGFHLIGPALDAPDDADPATRLLAIVGRNAST